MHTSAVGTSGPPPPRCRAYVTAITSSLVWWRPRRPRTVAIHPVHQGLHAMDHAGPRKVLYDVCERVNERTRNVAPAPRTKCRPQAN